MNDNELEQALEQLQGRLNSTVTDLHEEQKARVADREQHDKCLRECEAEVQRFAVEADRFRGWLKQLIDEPTEWRREKVIREMAGLDE